MDIADLERNEARKPSDIAIKGQLIAAYSAAGMLSEANEARERLVEISVPTESQWLEWYYDSNNITVLRRAISEFWYPEVAVTLIKETQAIRPSKLLGLLAKLKKRSASVEVWRDIRAASAENIWMEQFAIPMPGMNVAWQEYQNQVKTPEHDVKILYLSTFSIWKKLEPIYEQLCNADEMKSQEFLTQYIENWPEKQYLFEDLLLQNPQRAGIWICYIMQFKSYKIARRALRNWPDNINIIQAALILCQSAQHPISELLNSVLSNASQGHTDIWLLYWSLNNSSWKQGYDWLAENLPGEEHVFAVGWAKAEPSRSKGLFKKALAARGTQSFFWAAYISSKTDPGQIRKAYKKAHKRVEDYPEHMAQEWYNWELTQGDPDSLFQAWTASQTTKTSTQTEPSASNLLPKKRNREEKNSQKHTIFLKNLSPETTEDNLEDIIGQIAHVSDARIVRNLKGESRRIAYVDLESTQDAEAVINSFNGMEIDGSIVEVLKSKPPNRESESTLYISNLTEDITHQHIQELFPESVEIRIPTNPDGSIRGFAYVDLGSQSLEPYLGSHDVNGHCIRATRSRPDQELVLMVRNLPYTTTKEEISSHFRGSVAVTLPLDETGKSKGFAFIEFSNSTQVQRALAKKHIIGDRPIVIKKSKNRAKRNTDFKSLL